MTPLETGKKIHDLRIDRGLTQKDLADAVGVTDKAVSRWETGRNFPDIASLEKIAEALGCQVSDILGGGDISELSSAESGRPAIPVRRLKVTAAVWVLTPLLALLIPYGWLLAHHRIFAVVAVIYFILMGIWFGRRLPVRTSVVTILVIFTVEIAVDELLCALSRAGFFSGSLLNQLPYKLYGGLMIWMTMGWGNSLVLYDVISGWAWFMISLVFCAALMVGLFMAGMAAARLLQKR
ncbi:MAG: helix-turn-helix transcriptional regulator [Lachnospiraceae bacterium]|nr:helix-turn-helix transcriptional regulator [Lachnospiraceae bacterium]